MLCQVCLFQEVRKVSTLMDSHMLEIKFHVVKSFFFVLTF